nr:terminase [Mycobacterium sp.]
MKAGPKAAVNDSELAFAPTSRGASAFAEFCQQFIKVPKGTGAKSPLRLRDWQRDLIGSVEDADPQPRTAGWMLPRGQGKSTLLAAL